MIHKASAAVEAFSAPDGIGMIHLLEYSIENALGSPSLDAGSPSDTLSIYHLRDRKLYGCVMGRSKSRMNRSELFASGSSIKLFVVNEMKYQIASPIRYYNRPIGYDVLPRMLALATAHSIISRADRASDTPFLRSALLLRQSAARGLSREATRRKPKWRSTHAQWSVPQPRVCLCGPASQDKLRATMKSQSQTFGACAITIQPVDRSSKIQRVRLVDRELLLIVFPQI